MVKHVEPTPQIMHEVLITAAVFVCKGYAQSTRRALFLACHDHYDRTEYSTFGLFNNICRYMSKEVPVFCDPFLNYLGGWSSGKAWLSAEHKEMLMMSFLWAAGRLESDAEIFGDRGPESINVTQCNPMNPTLIGWPINS